MAEDEAEVEALLLRITLAKQKELRLRAEKKRIRDELGELQAGTLWSREEQTQKQILAVRRTKKQVEAQWKAEEEKLAKLSDDLKEQEMEFRRGVNSKPSPFQQAAVQVVATATQINEGSNQKENARLLAEVLDDTVSALTDMPKAASMVLSRYDTLQRLIRNINCNEQQQRIGRLQAELEKSNSQRKEVNLDVPPSVMARCANIITSEDISSSTKCQDSDYAPCLTLPISKTQKSSDSPTARKSSSKLNHITPLDRFHPVTYTPPVTSTHPAEHVPATSLTQQAVLPTAPNPMYTPPFAGGWPQNYPVPVISMAPYSHFSLPMLPVSRHGIGFRSQFLPSCSYPGARPWLPLGALYSLQGENVPSSEQPAKSALNRQEEDVRRLERELEMQRISNEYQAEAKEFARLQSCLLELQSKISTLTAADNPPADVTDEVAADDKNDSSLRSLKRQHLENVVKVRNERDLLEEQEKLEELKERIQRRRVEKIRHLDHEKWVAKQNRELIAQRLYRAIQQNEVKPKGLSSVIQEKSAQPYNPDRGFTLIWDFVAGVPATVNNLQITYGIYDGRIIRTSFKVVYAKEIKATSPQQQLSLFISSSHVKQLPATRDLRVIVEVSSVMQNGADGAHAPTTLGWTAFDMFKEASEGELSLACGFYKLPVKQSSTPDPSETLVVPPTTGECGDMRIYIRVVHGERSGEASRVLMDPELHAERYQLAGIEKALLRPHPTDIKTCLPSVQVRKSTRDKPTTTKPVDGQEAMSRSTSIERYFDPPTTSFPLKQDFLDVDRLRLLSSTSSRPPSMRSRSNIPHSGDKTQLTVFREDSKAKTEEPWVRVDKTPELQRLLLSGNLFLNGDGFDVYIDGGRGFPDSVSLSKVTIAAFHADRTQFVAANGNMLATPMSNIFDPVYDASRDGFTLLSRKNFLPHEWEANGLLIPAPQYYDKFYDSLRCVPSGIEEKIYSIRKNRKPMTITQCLQQMSLYTSEAQDMLKAKPPNNLDLLSALRYEPAIGFQVAVDALHNVKARGGLFFKVLFSVYPPGSFYKAIRLTEGVHFTTTMDWTSAQTSPEFNDGYMTLRDSPSDQMLVILFDIRSLTRHPKTGATTSQQYGWTFLPVLTISRSINTCNSQLPLFQGEVNLDLFKTAISGLNALVDDIGNENVKKLVPVAESGASLFVRLQNPQMPHMSTQPIVDARLSKMVPPRHAAKYAYDSAKIAALKKKTPLNKLLPGNTLDKQFEKELNQAFVQPTDWHPHTPDLNVVLSVRRWAFITCFSKVGTKLRMSTKCPLPRLHRRPQAPLQLEDFEDVRYKMEIVRLGNDTNSTDNRVALLDSLFLALIFYPLLLGGCVAVGFATHWTESTREVLSYLLPMLLLPLAWVASLVVWERRAIAMQSKIASQ
ncbi:LOW QUALITY PROTEIN: hypothetical protein PHMEG_00012658 [Phytophthora megakarya]|uniref:Uncharacterized protein n=1 Tax=Phytophthora megakarya TaxID=4795 RepID=A0A225W877_9STRA|nr:LOW QUALITY PROTEIN: hypothetical protein PHMEG_00012658 [Phytophthora megakarya]